MGKKVGTNFEDRNRIAEWAARGKSAAEISDLLGIVEEAVQHSMPEKPKPKAKPKAEPEDES